MTGGLWKDHNLTPRQRQLILRHTVVRRNRPTQADMLLTMLRDARARKLALELPAIMAVGIAQHGARIAELRERGFGIENQLERTMDGRVLSRYWLRLDPERDGVDAK